MRSPALARSAALVIALEGAALLVVVFVEVFGLASGDVANVVSGVALIALTLIGALALVAFAIGIARGRSWARSGAVVLQVIAVVLALAALTLSPIVWPFVLGLGLPGALALVLIIASARREVVGPNDTDAGTGDKTDSAA